MSDLVHPAASDHLPSFITAPGQTDALMVVMSIILLLFVLMVGVLYFRLHALPERASAPVLILRTAYNLELGLESVLKGCYVDGCITRSRSKYRLIGLTMME